jgi:hypothetical protein
MKERAREAGDSPFIEQIAGFGLSQLRALRSFRFVNLGFRFAPPQALCFHPLRAQGTKVGTCSELPEVCATQFND